MNYSSWPKWFYPPGRPASDGQIFASSTDVPEGWGAEPSAPVETEAAPIVADLGAPLDSPHAVNLLRAENLGLTAQLDQARAELEALRAEVATMRAGVTRKRTKADPAPADPAPPPAAPEPTTDDFVPPSVDPDAP